MRLFVAIALPEEVRESLAGLANSLPGARWIGVENLHLTLRFLGELDGAQAHDLDDALSDLRAPSFDLELAGVSHFGEGRNLRTLWVGVAANPLLQRLHGKIEQAAIRSGMPPDKRKFKPHITLARFKSDPGVKLPEFIAAHSLFRLPAFPVNSFALYSSFLAGEGAIYRIEAEYPLETPNGTG